MTNIKRLVTLLLVILATPWFWRLYSINFFVVATVVIISMLFFYLAFTTVRFKTFLWFGLLYGLTLVLAFLIRDQFDFGLGVLNSVEKTILSARQNYLGLEVGRIFLNRIGLGFFYDYNPLIEHFIRNFFYVLDPNQYFFGSHPRERANVFEFAKFWPIFLPFWVIGLSRFLSISKLTGTYMLTVVLLSIFISLNSPIGPIFIIPIILVAICEGIYKTISWIKR